jgi:hypothetical protein
MERHIDDELSMTEPDPPGPLHRFLSRLPTAARKPVLIGVTIGLVLVLAPLGWWVVDRARTPATPHIGTVSLDEVLAFIVNERGLPRLSHIEQDRFLTTWHDFYSQEENQRELKRRLEASTEQKRADVRKVFFEISKRRFLDDARHYLRIKDDRDKAYAFIVDRLGHFSAETAWLRGYGDPQRDLSSVLGTGLPRNPEDWTELIVRHTTPEERVLGEQYLHAIKTVRDQERSKSRQAPDSPG